MKVWRKLVLSILVFIIVLLGGIEFLVNTTRGLHVLFYIINRSVPELKIDHISGNLHNLHLKNIQYHQPGIAISIGEFNLETQFNFFLNRKLYVKNFFLKNTIMLIDSKELCLPSSNVFQKEKNNSFLCFFSSYPITFYTIIINNINIKINNAMISVMHFNSGLHWNKGHLTLTPTLLQEVLLSTKKEKSLEYRRQYPQLQKGLFKNKLYSLFSRSIISEINNVFDNLPLYLNIEEFRIKKLYFIGNTDLVILNLLAKLSSSNKNINLQVLNIESNLGSINASANGVFYNPGSVRIFVNSVLNVNSFNNEKIYIKINGVIQEKLNFSINFSGPMNLTFRGQTQLAKAGMPFNFEALGTHLLWRLNSDRKYQVDNIRLKINGKISNYRLVFYTIIKGQGIPEGTISISAKGNKQQIKIDKLIIKVLDGKAELAGVINWKQAIRWCGDLKIININTVKALPTWPSKFNGIVKTRGIMNKKNWQIDFPTIKVVGNIKQNKIEVDGSLKGNSYLQWIVPNLKMMLGQNIVNIQGELGAKNLNLDTSIDASNLSNILVGIHGVAKGLIKVRGTIKEPKLLTNIVVSRFHWKNISANRIQIHGAVQSFKQIFGKVSLRIEQIMQPETYTHFATLVIQGSEKQHDLQFHIQGNSVSGKLHFSGSFNRQEEFWRGKFDDIQFNTPIGPLTISHVIALRYYNSEQKISIGPHCWNNSNIGLCVSKTIDIGAKKGNVTINFNHFNLAVLKQFIPGTVQACGIFSGQVSANWGTRKEELAHTKIQFFGRTIKIVKIVNTVPIVAMFDTIKFHADLYKNFIECEWFMHIANNEFITGKIQVNNLQKKHKIKCNMNIHNFDISKVNTALLSHKRTTGFLNANLLLEGDLQNPHLYGQMNLSDIRIGGNFIPFDMRSSQFTIHFNGTNSALTGEIYTSKGKIHLTGNAYWNSINNWMVRIIAKGSKVRITIPSIAQLDASPKIVLKIEPSLFTLEGNIDIPWARFLIHNVPENVLGISRDEILLNESLQPIQQGHVNIPLNTNLTIHLGSDVRLNTFSLKTKINGDLKFTQDKRGIGVNGQINILDGRLYAYGQDLIIRKSELLFSGPLDQLALHIEAIRNPDTIEGNVIAGVRITGSTDNPKVEIFSDPVMSQQTALSYLLYGQDFSNNQNDNTKMTSMLIGIGIAQSSKIIDKIGEIFGISNLMLDTHGVGSSSQIIISGYILPGLQIKYGIRIFDSLTTLALRYRLIPNLYLEATSGIDQTLDLLYQFKF